MYSKILFGVLQASFHPVLREPRLAQVSPQQHHAGGGVRENLGKFQGHLGSHIAVDLTSEPRT